MTAPIVVVLVIAALVVLALRTFAKRAAAARAEHEARLAAMAQVHLAAARKKKAAEAAAPARETANAAPVREERECPFCAELILKKARVCKHCGREVDPLR